MIVRFCLLFVAIGLLLLVFLQEDFIPSSLLASIDQSIDAEQELFSSCNLAELGDGWTKEVRRLARVNKNPIKNCNKAFKPMTAFDERGCLSIRSDLKNIHCVARSVEFLTERTVRHGDWTNLTHRPSPAFASDIIQTRCFSNGSKVEDFIHMQIVRKKKDVAKVGEGAPSVYIFVIDSVSNSQALRSLPKTIDLLKKSHDAVNLRHVNKVGENSHPNGMVLFFGKMTSRLDRSVFGRPSVAPDWTKDQHCFSYLDNRVGFPLLS